MKQPKGIFFQTLVHLGIAKPQGYTSEDIVEISTYELGDIMVKFDLVIDPSIVVFRANRFPIVLVVAIPARTILGHSGHI